MALPILALVTVRITPPISSEINIPVVSILWRYSGLPPAQSDRFTLNQAEPAMLLPSNSLVMPADGPQVAAVENAAPPATVKNTMKKQ